MKSNLSELNITSSNRIAIIFSKTMINKGLFDK